MKTLLFFFLIAYSLSAFSSNVSLEKLGKIEDFTLLDSKNRPFQYAKTLQGKNWFAIFIFTKCQLVCPRLVDQLKHFSTKWPDAHYVAFSVDSEFDKPSVLEAFSKKHALENKANWHFLTGEKEYIQKIIWQQFLVPTKQDAHSQKAILIDRSGLIRGYYSLKEEQQLMAEWLHALK